MSVTAKSKRRERIDRSIKVRSDGLYALMSWREMSYLIAPRLALIAGLLLLPLIMGVSMFVQQKLNPAPPDPMQAKIMLYLPLVFGVMFAFFPAGLVLYWVVNNLLSIAQQYVITKRIEEGAKA